MHSFSVAMSQITTDSVAYTNIHLLSPSFRRLRISGFPAQGFPRQIQVVNGGVVSSPAQDPLTKSFKSWPALDSSRLQDRGCWVLAAISQRLFSAPRGYALFLPHTDVCSFKTSIRISLAFHLFTSFKESPYQIRFTPIIFLLVKPKPTCQRL